MATVLEVSVAVVDLVGALAFAYIAFVLARIARSIGGSIDTANGFIVLALAQVSATIAILSSGRIAYTFYVATSIFSAAGFTIIFTSRKKLYTITLPALLPILSDAIATVAALIASYRFRGVAKILVASLSIGFILRLASLFLLPSSSGVLLLVLGEYSRSIVATALAVFYALPQGGR